MNGAYNFYGPQSDTPILCEILNGYAYFFDLDRPVPVSKMARRFVRLVEELEHAWPAVPDLEGIDRFAHLPVTGAPIDIKPATQDVV